jgi:hypothetical protein
MSVGNVINQKDLATKMCANYCSTHDWCGAFFLSLPNMDGGKCHLVHHSETTGDQHIVTYHGIGEPRFYLLTELSLEVKNFPFFRSRTRVLSQDGSLEQRRRDSVWLARLNGDA